MHRTFTSSGPNLDPLKETVLWMSEMRPARKLCICIHNASSKVAIYVTFEVNDYGNILSVFGSSSDPHRHRQIELVGP